MSKLLLPSYAEDAVDDVHDLLHEIDFARTHAVDTALTGVTESPFGTRRVVQPRENVFLHDPTFRAHHARIHRLTLRERFVACFKTPVEWEKFVRTGDVPSPTLSESLRHNGTYAAIFKEVADEIREAEIFRLQSDDVSADPRIPLNQSWSSIGHVPALTTQVIELTQDQIPEERAQAMITHVMLDKDPMRPSAHRVPQHLLFLTLLPCGERWNDDFQRTAFEVVLSDLPDDHARAIHTFLHTPPENNLSARIGGEKDAPKGETLEYLGDIVPMVGGSDFHNLSAPILRDIRPQMLDERVALQTASRWTDEGPNLLTLAYEQAVTDYDYTTADICNIQHLYGLLRHFRTLRHNLVHEESFSIDSPILPN